MNDEPIWPFGEMFRLWVFMMAFIAFLTLLFCLMGKAFAACPPATIEHSYSKEVFTTESAARKFANEHDGYVYHPAENVYYVEYPVTVVTSNVVDCEE